MFLSIYDPLTEKTVNLEQQTIHFMSLAMAFCVNQALKIKNKTRSLRYAKKNKLFTPNL